MGVLGFIIMAPVAMACVIGLFLLILILGYVLYIKPLLDWLGRKDGGFFKRIVFWPVRKAAAAAERFARTHVANLTRHFLSNAPVLVKTLDHITEMTNRIAGTFGDMAEQTWQALWTLRHVTVPALITQALAPIRTQINRTIDRVDALEDRNRRVSNAIADMLRSLPWGVGGDYVPNFERWLATYRHLWDQTFNTLMPRVNELWNNRVDNLRNRIQAIEATLDAIQTQGLPAIRQRITDLERGVATILTDPTTWVLTMLGLALVPALSATAMRQALANLTCRNVQTAAQNICASDATLIDDLFGMLLLVAGPFSIVEASRILQGVTREVSDGIHYFVTP